MKEKKYMSNRVLQVFKAPSPSTFLLSSILVLACARLGNSEEPTGGLRRGWGTGRQGEMRKSENDMNTLQEKNGVTFYLYAHMTHTLSLLGKINSCARSTYIYMYSESLLAWDG